MAWLSPTCAHSHNHKGNPGSPTRELLRGPPVHNLAFHGRMERGTWKPMVIAMEPSIAVLADCGSRRISSMSGGRGVQRVKAHVYFMSGSQSLVRGWAGGFSAAPSYVHSWLGPGVKSQ